MATANTQGTIVQVIGAVTDIEFPRDASANPSGRLTDHHGSDDGCKRRQPAGQSFAVELGALVTDEQRPHHQQMPR